MNDFKAGDKVEYFGPMKDRLGIYTIKRINSEWADVEESGTFGPLFENLRHVTPAATPDMITIDRADLPDVTVNGIHLIADKNIFGRFLDADGHWKMALSQLAVAEYLAREKAAKADAATDEAADKLNKRRDELAEMVAKNSGWTSWIGTGYFEHQSEAQAAIDMMIAAETNRG